MKYLSKYHAWIKLGEIPQGGLCKCPHDEKLELFEPTDSDINELQRKGLSCGWWGSGVSADSIDKYRSFTPLRQNIILFLAAMNGEL